MSHTIISVRHKEPAWMSAAADEFLKRMSGQVEEVVVRPQVRSNKDLSAAQINRCKEREGEGILRAVRDGAKKSWVVGLDVRGTAHSTEALADKINVWRQAGKIVWIIGGADGLSAEVLAQCQSRVSLSLLTFPHALARLILLEQIYRATTILEGHPYHRM